MLVIRPFIFRQFPEIVCGFSTKIGPNPSAPFYFNLSYSVGDKKEIVNGRRELFFAELGLNENTVSYQKQVHEDNIREVNEHGFCGESDALITISTNLGLAISSADCPAIFIYDPVKKVIAAVHSGWRGTKKQILRKTILKLKNDFKSNASELVIYLGPSISQINYEVGEEDLHVFVHQRSVVEQHRKAVELYLRGQMPVNQEVGRLREAGVQGQLFHWNAAIAQNALLAVHEGDGTGAAARVGVAGVERDKAGILPQA